MLSISNGTLKSSLPPIESVRIEMNSALPGDNQIH